MSKRKNSLSIFLIIILILLSIFVIILWLQNNYCTGEYNKLADRYIEDLERPRIEIHNQTINFAFKRTDGQMEYWTIPFSSLEASINLGFLAREMYPQTSLSYIDLRSEEKTVRVMDFSEFIIPKSFGEFSKKLYYEKDGDYEFIHEIWYFITQMTAYSTEIEETPKYPLETLFSGGGDCEDLSILFASVIKAAPPDWDVSLIYMDANNPEDPKEANHVIVQIKTDKETYLIDATSTSVMDPFEKISGWELELKD